MKKYTLLLVLILFIGLPCFANGKDLKLPNIFITDTTEIEDTQEDNMVLKGYAEYLKDTDAIYLKNENDEFVLNLKVPQKITSKSLIGEHKKITDTRKANRFSKYDNEEYRIGSNSHSSSISNQGLSIGTSYDNDVDYAQFEQTTGFFTKYENKRFSIKTSYERTIGSADGNYIDQFYLIPELKINKYVSLKEILSNNVTYRRKKAEFVISINPLAHTKENRLNFELGAAQMYDDHNALIKNQFKFNTKFKL